ncbi:MAG: hypothetical protein JSV27_11325 [Candidatus Bathyarchaeota archaeon]|nr:MAG: hypothetical protein JSV27_11325 [Candidatus Bathyarchaeota archaeon]
MAQETIIEIAEDPPADEINDALTVCGACHHLVPRTMVCLYCGAPILFKEPGAVS